MSNNVFFTNGSTWVKADFHLHTNKDKEFIFNNDTGYEDDNVFPTLYIEKLKKENIRVGLITNHNKFDRGEFNCLRKKAEKENILLIPGVELSISEGAHGLHLLIAFSSDWLSGKDSINLFIQEMFPRLTAEEYQNKNLFSELGLAETVKKLNNYGFEYFLIFAHVDQGNGLLEELSPGQAQKLIEDNLKDVVWGVQKVTQPERIKKLGFVSVPFVEGSDPKSIEEIGKGSRHCWIKIGAFSFDAVKFALSEYNERLTVKEPKESCKHSFIRRVVFTGGFLDGTDLNFSSELNSLIGIRGSGKSAVLESINYGLNLPLNENRSDADYKKNLLIYALGSGGQISIEVVTADGHVFTIKRSLNRLPEITYDGIYQPDLKINETVIHRPLFFGQKELSGRSEQFDSSFVDKLIGDKLYDIRKNINEKKSSIIEDVNLLAQLRNLDEEKTNLERNIKDNQFNLEKFKEYKIEERLKKQTDFNEDERLLNELEVNYESIVKRIDALLNEVTDGIFNASLSESNKIFEEEINTIGLDVSDVEELLRKARDKMQGLTKKLKETLCRFENQKEKNNEEFDRTKRDIEAEIRKMGAPITMHLDDYQNIQDKIAKDRSRLNTVSLKEQIKKERENRLSTNLSNLVELWREEFRIIEKELKKINDGQHFIEIQSIFEGDKNVFQSYLQSMFRGSGLTKNDYVSLTEKYPDCIEMYKDINAASLLIASEKNRSNFKEFFITNLKDLLVYQVPNAYKIFYNKKDISTLSLGQRASAMILFILGQKDNDIVIIDQPEDDLDNHTIYEDVIKMIVSLKPEIQFIFATHNANIPVLGDSEMVHCCESKDESGIANISVSSGSIDDPVMQKDIINVMEGGREAFELRKEIYGLWKS